MKQPRPRPLLAPPKLLHRHSQKGYTSEPLEALSHEPEAIDSESLDGFAVDNWRRHVEHHQEDVLRQRLRSMTSRMREQTLRAWRQGIDVSPELARIEAQLAEMERKRDLAA
jgi:hypothetical protein